jgi:hypothetical protein
MRRRIPWAVFMLSVLHAPAEAGRLIKVWDFHAKVIPGVETAGSPLGVYSLSFSRDGCPDQNRLPPVAKVRTVTTQSTVHHYPRHRPA